MKKKTNTNAVIDGANAELTELLTRYVFSDYETRRHGGKPGRLYIRLVEKLPEIKFKVDCH